MDWILENWTELALGLLTFADLVVSFHPRWKGRGLGYLRAVVVALAAMPAPPSDDAPEKVEKRKR